jgi:epoxyqueuosine reductase QueG
MPIPASQITNARLHKGAISHKAIAAIAGLGWIGRSQLLVNPKLGPRLRLASILTDMPLQPGKPVRNRCGECEACVKACPTHAIKPVGVMEAGWVREEVFDPDACFQRLVKFRDDPLYGASICGICVKVCPFGRKPRR